MSTQTTSVINKGLELVFEPIEHKYTVGDDQYTSVTTFVKSHFAEFDSESIAIKYANKHGLNKEDVLKKWADDGQIASDFGTKIHLWAESLLNKEEIVEEGTEKELKYLASLKDWINNIFFERFDLIECEKMIFSPKYKLAGTIDVLARNKKTGDIYILDWKTNKKLVKKNDFGQKGLGLLSEVDDCNFNHYSLQLSSYEKILKEEYFPDDNFKKMILYITDSKVYSYNTKEVIDIDELIK